MHIKIGVGKKGFTRKKKECTHFHLFAKNVKGDFSTLLNNSLIGLNYVVYLQIYWSNTELHKRIQVLFQFWTETA